MTPISIGDYNLLVTTKVIEDEDYDHDCFSDGEREDHDQNAETGSGSPQGERESAR